jgi:hypothetical protein
MTGRRFAPVTEFLSFTIAFCGHLHASSQRPFSKRISHGLCGGPSAEWASVIHCSAINMSERTIYDISCLEV